MPSPEFASLINSRKTRQSSYEPGSLPAYRSHSPSRNEARSRSPKYPRYILLLGFASICYALGSLYGSYQAKNKTEDEENIVDIAPAPRRPTVKRIALLGERNTGTNWMTDELVRCFPEIEVTPYLTRWKHWFQEDVSSLYPHRGTPTLVIAQFRNTYEWLESMRATPHNMPNHNGLEWPAFVTTPWTMERPDRDINLSVKEGHICQQNFTYTEVISCVEGTVPDNYKEILAQQKLEKGDTMHRKGQRRRSLRSEFQPIYELKNDKSGKAYSSILYMREDKIRNFFTVESWDWVEAFIPVRYEKLLSEGTKFLLDDIKEKTGLEYTCVPDAKQPDRPKRPLDPKFIEWVNIHADWEVEGRIGYKPR